MKNSNKSIGNRTRDLPTCNAVGQPTAPPRPPVSAMAESFFSRLRIASQKPRTLRNTALITSNLAHKRRDKNRVPPSNPPHTHILARSAKLNQFLCFGVLTCVRLRKVLSRLHCSERLTSLQLLDYACSHRWN